MNTIDEILASGRYTDRRGHAWEMWFDFHNVSAWVPGDEQWPALTPNEMRLLIERDQHRDECLGLWECIDHPVPRVAVIESDYGSFARNSRVYDQHSTHPEAMDAARALAVGA